MAVQYEGALPIPKAWAEKHVDKRIILPVAMGLYDLLNMDGVEEMNERVDKLTGIELEDIHYVAQRIEHGRVVLQVSGYILDGPM